MRPRTQSSPPIPGVFSGGPRAPPPAGPRAPAPPPSSTSGFGRGRPQLVAAPPFSRTRVGSAASRVGAAHPGPRRATGCWPGPGTHRSTRSCRTWGTWRPWPVRSRSARVLRPRPSPRRRRRRRPARPARPAVCAPIGLRPGRGVGSPPSGSGRRGGGGAPAGADGGRLDPPGAPGSRARGGLYPGPPCPRLFPWQRRGSQPGRGWGWESAAPSTGGVLASGGLGPEARRRDKQTDSPTADRSALPGPGARVPKGTLPHPAARRHPASLCCSVSIATALRWDRSGIPGGRATGPGPVPAPPNTVSGAEGPAGGGQGACHFQKQRERNCWKGVGEGMPGTEGTRGAVLQALKSSSPSSPTRGR